MRQLRARPAETALVQSRVEVGPLQFRLDLIAPRAAGASPGQFVFVRCADHGSLAPLLRRPFGVHDADPGTGLLSILFAMRGAGTDYLARRRPGEALDLMGPLGHGFTLPDHDPDTNSNPGPVRDPNPGPVRSLRGVDAVHPGRVRPVLLIGGGMGAAPLLLLGRFLVRAGFGVTACLGARTGEFLVGAAALQEIGVRVLIATDDGSMGRRGPVTDLVQQHVRTHRPIRAYACGPAPMLRAVQGILAGERISGELSLEERMGCGIGACAGCVVTVAQKEPVYRKVCSDGPVFRADEILFPSEGTPL